MINPLQMNDWEMKKFFRVVLSIQLATWGAVGLDSLGIHLPVFRQLIIFIYLTFVPGLLMLRILRLHELTNIESLLYAVGLSIATVMFTGLLVNTIYPLLGLQYPMSITPLLITMSAIVLVMCLLCYLRDRGFSNPKFIDARKALSPPTLFLCLIPIMAILGTYLVDFYQYNFVLMLMLILVSTIVVLVALDKFIPRNLYPLGIFAVSISLLFHRSLVSMFLVGWDIHHEYYLANLVIEGSYWNSTIPYNTNAMLSIVMYAPVFSILSNMDLVWVFKIVYPLLFSLVPLGLYRVFQKQTDERIAFLASFFFVSFFVFYGEMVQLARQQIAELFLVLLILLVMSKSMHKTKRSFLFLIFAASLVVSHYGLSYIYLFSLLFASLILILTTSPAARGFKDVLARRLHRYRWKRTPKGSIPSSRKNRTMSPSYILLFVTFSIAWYIFVSSSSTFAAIVSIGEHIAYSISTEFLNPQAVEGLHLVLQEPGSPLHNIAKYIQLAMQFFIVIGVIGLLLRRRNTKFDDEYIALSIASFMLLLAAMVLPYFASSLNTTRLYHVALIFLAPFCIIGWMTVSRIVTGFFKTSWKGKSAQDSLKVLSAFLAVFLLFNSGFVYEVAKDDPTSLSLDRSLDGPHFNEQEVLGARWSYDMGSNHSVYADEYRWLLLGSLNWEQARRLPDNLSRIPANSYIYMGSHNMMEGSLLVGNKEEGVKTTKYVDSSDVVDRRNKIYDNGGAQVYYG